MIWLPEDEALIFDLAHSFTGATYGDPSRRWLKKARIAERMKELGITALAEYLHRIESDAAEFELFVSMMTIHTTSWFRESSHFHLIRDDILRTKKQKVSVLSAACSTGQEVYSLALTLEGLKATVPGFHFEIMGFDIDPVSIRTAQEGRYKEDLLEEIPEEYHGVFEVTESGYFRVPRSFKERCRFMALALQQERLDFNERFDYVLCRNVLIYFESTRIKEFGDRLLRYTKPDGLLMVGHSEALPLTADQAVNFKPSVYRKREGHGAGPSVTESRRVLVVDVSNAIRENVKRGLESKGAIVDVAPTVPSPEALKSMVAPHLLIVSSQGDPTGILESLRALRQGGVKIPVLLLVEKASGFTAQVVGGLDRGLIQDIVHREDVLSRSKEILDRITALIGTTHQLQNRRRASARSAAIKPEVILIGASTGGPEALGELLRAWPKTSPPLVVVQHMPPEFTMAFARRLAAESQLTLNTGSGPLAHGQIAMPIDHRHVTVVRKGQDLWPKWLSSPPRSGHSPSVDELFFSVVSQEISGVAVLLTGMGKDGASGMLELSKKNFLTCAQSRESSIVWGMPREAIALGAVDFVGNIQELRSVLLGRIAA